MLVWYCYRLTVQLVTPAAWLCLWRHLDMAPIIWSFINMLIFHRFSPNLSVPQDICKHVLYSWNQTAIHMNPVVPLHGMLLGSTWPHKQPKMQAGMETSFATSANGTGNPFTSSAVQGASWCQVSLFWLCSEQTVSQFFLNASQPHCQGLIPNLWILPNFLVSDCHHTLISYQGI